MKKYVILPYKGKNVSLMFKSFSKAFMLYKQLMSLTEKTINTIVYHFNYNAICHKTAIRQICHIKSQIACITFISNKLKALFLDFYVAHAQLHIITFH